MGGGRLRVVYNASALPRRPAGAGIYTRELAAALAARDDVDVVVAAPQWADIAADERVASPSGGPIRRSAWEQTAMRRVLQSADVYHGTHMATPIGTSTRTVATVHDLTFYRIPRRYSSGRRRYYRLLARTAARADRIIVPSSAVATDVVRYLGYAPECIRVIPEAARAALRPANREEVERVRRRMGLERKYLLCLGTAEPGKRAVDAIRAMALLGDLTDLELVLAGNPGRLSEPLRREAERLGIGKRVRFVGYVNDESLAPLLTGAVALVFPSLYEGFGLPPLEAMACGTPVIATWAPAMDEVLEGAALFVRLRDPEAIARSIRRLEAIGEHADWAARGLEHASRLSWQRTAEQTVDVYREIAR